MKKEKLISYMLTIKPALTPKERHEIEDALKQLGYRVRGGGTRTDMSECDISFEKKTKPLRTSP